MCRLFGLIADHTTDISYWMAGCERPFQSWANVHCHGYGVGWYEQGRACVKKEPISALASQQFPQVAASAKSHLFVTHLRKATVGDHTIENCHPFVHNSWLFAHNGTIDRDALITRLDTEHRSRLTGATDSEVLFHWILQETQRDPEVPHASGLLKRFRKAANNLSPAPLPLGEGGAATGKGRASSLHSDFSKELRKDTNGLSPSPSPRWGEGARMADEGFLQQTPLEEGAAKQSDVAKHLGAVEKVSQNRICSPSPIHGRGGREAQGEGSFPARLKTAITEVKKHPYTSLKFLLTDGHTLYAYREAIDKLDYYTLYYLSKTTPSGRTVIVCSEKLTDDNWLEIPNGHLLIVPPTLTPVLSGSAL